MGQRGNKNLNKKFRKLKWLVAEILIDKLGL